MLQAMASVLNWYVGVRLMMEIGRDGDGVGTYLDVLTGPDVGSFDRFEDCALVLDDAV